MSQNKIKKTVMQSAVDALATISGFTVETSVAWPSLAFTPATAAWIRVSYMPTKSSTETFGIGGENELLGILQFDVSIPTNGGDKEQDRILTALELRYIPGVSVTLNGQPVSFISCDRSNGRHVDGFWRVSLSVTFRARYSRPNFLALPMAYRDENGLLYIGANNMTSSQILLLTAEAYPRLIKATNNGLYYAIDANALGSTAYEFNSSGGGFTITSENELEVANGADTLWAPLKKI